MRSTVSLKAIKLRQQGYSLNEIVERLGCAKSSASVWVRNVKLTALQKQNLRNNQNKARAKASNHPNSPKSKWLRIREEVITKSTHEIPLKPSQLNLILVCAALYWGEGYKKTRNMFVFANTDPEMIVLMMEFVRKICHVPLAKIRGRVNLHPEHPSHISEKYWSNLSGIPITQFHKPLLAIPRSSKGIRKSLPYGTFRIIISDVILVSRIFGWIDGIKKWIHTGK